MFPTTWDFTTTHWFEFVPLSPDDLHAVARTLNLALRPEGHFAHVRPIAGRPLIAVRVRAEHPARALEQILRSNGIDAYFFPLAPDHSPTTAH